MESGRFVNNGVQDMVDEKSYSQFSDLFVNRLLLRDLPTRINSDSHRIAPAHLIAHNRGPEFLDKVGHFFGIF